MPAKWRFWIDRGGTFTDVIGRSPTGEIKAAKLLSSGVDGIDAASAGIRLLLGIDGKAKLPSSSIEEVRMGTTVATNALLTRRGAKVALLITGGFADLLLIRNQSRPDLFELYPRREPVLYRKVIEIDERLRSDGGVERPLALDGLRPRLSRLRKQGIEAVAIVCLHSHRHGKHEQAVARLCREMGFEWVFASADVEPVVGALARGETTVADAFLTPPLRRHADALAKNLGGVRLQFMQSNGGLTSAETFSGRNAVLSGPAGGVIGAAAVALQAGKKRMVSFDMGGTSTDVAHWEGQLERTTETKLAGTSLLTPMLRVNTVAAGGGSICWHELGRLRVGPQSAGANPGPACYGHGGPLTVTDCNLLLGRLVPDALPAAFGPKRNRHIDAKPAEKRLFELATKSGFRGGGVKLAEALVDIAVERMAKAVKSISVQRGHDLERGYSLVAFGGAGGQHACQLAERLGIDNVLIHPLAGLLSAAGIGIASVRSIRQRSLEQPLAGNMAKIKEMLAKMAKQARAEVENSAGPQELALKLERRLLLRYVGESGSIRVAYASTAKMLAEFTAKHKSVYGYSAKKREVIVAGLEAEVANKPGSLSDLRLMGAAAGDMISGETKIYTKGKWSKAQMISRGKLREDAVLAGPALILEDTATTYLPEGWSAGIQKNGVLTLCRLKRKTKAAKRSAASNDQSRLEVFHSLFTGAAEQMGHVLRNTATSVNIKDRLDFSCAVFDAKGGMVANAPHIPVHLGSMDISVRRVIAANRNRIRPGDSWLLNAPNAGGTHLPDLTVVTPVFLAGGRQPAFFACSRGHHVDVGGITPGSMPARSGSLAEEGIVFDNFQLLKAGRLRLKELKEQLASGPYPARSPELNIADLRAQLAANARGAKELLRACEEHGSATVQAYMRRIQDNAAAAVRELLGGLKDGSHEVRMDDGSLIKVALKLAANRRSATIDFSGTSSQSPRNLNAPPAVVRAGVCYVLRCLLAKDIPLNSGVLRPIRLRLPAGSMINPGGDAAVAAGNVEVSQAVVDCLLGAVKAAAASQGTMNNLTMGNERYQYYETICGGAGAGAGMPGEDAIHTHMTNTRITDPEVLEDNLPLLLERFAIRRGSGGKGKWRGGAGAIRSIKFFEGMEVTMLANRRKIAPCGAAGGGDGALGANWIVRGGGGVDRQDGLASWRAEAGDVLEIRTPGGGGWGRRR